MTQISELLPMTLNRIGLFFILFSTPLIFAAPAPQTLYDQFKNFLLLNSCEIRPEIAYPFSEAPNAELFASELQVCQRKDSLIPGKPTRILCDEIFESLTNVTCNAKDVPLSQINIKPSNEVCDDFELMHEIIPDRRSILGKRLTDKIVCQFACADEFEHACQVLLWSYQVWNEIGKAMNDALQAQKQKPALDKNTEIKNSNKNALIGDQPEERPPNVDPIQSTVIKNPVSDPVSNQTTGPEPEVTSEKKMSNDQELDVDGDHNNSEDQVLLENNKTLKQDIPTKTKVLDGINRENVLNGKNGALAGETVTPDHSNVEVSSKTPDLLKSTGHNEEAEKTIKTGKDLSTTKSVSKIETKVSNVDNVKPAENNKIHEATVSKSEVKAGGSNQNVDNTKEKQNIATISKVEENNEFSPKETKVSNLSPEAVAPSNPKDVNPSTAAVPLEKMEDGSEIRPPVDKDQYIDTENMEGDFEGEYSRSDYDQVSKNSQPEVKVRKPDIMPNIVTVEKSSVPKSFDDFQSRNPIEQSSVDIQTIAAFENQEDNHFFFYFLSLVLILMAGYVIFHNKQKIIALIVEGRLDRRRRSHGVGYKKLETK